MHVCVIGAGVVGLTTAYFLQAEGHGVTVVDRADCVAAGASRAPGAQLAYTNALPWGGATLPARLLSLIPVRDAALKFRPRLDAQEWAWALAFLRATNTPSSQANSAALARLAELSREFIEPLIQGENIACAFARSGRLIIHDDAATFAKARVEADYQATRGAHVRALTREQCLAHEPALAPSAKRIAGGIWIATDAAADCGAFCDHLATVLAQRGVEFVLNQTIDRFDVAGSQVRALIASTSSASSNGAPPLRADAYVLAAGAQSAALAATAGLRLPISPVKGHSITVKPHDAPLLSVALSDMRRRVDFAPLGDRVRIAGYAEIGDEATTASPDRIGALLIAAREVLGYHTVDGDLQPSAAPGGATPGGVPIIGRTALANLVLNTGHGALGWAFAGGSARLACDAIAKRGPTIDVTPYAIAGR